MINVAIDSGPLTGGHSVRGIGVMVKEQIKAINREKNREIKLDVFDFQSEEGRSKLEKESFDIVHYPYFFPYSLTLPSRKYGKKMIVTIQDLIQLIYPKHYPPGIRGQINFLKQKARLKKVDAVITISETSKKDIVRFLGIPGEKVHVIYLAPKKIFRKLEIGNWKLAEVKKKYKLPNKFVLYVGDVNYNKNIVNLAKACEFAKIPLVICGKHALDIEKQGLDLKILRGPRDWIRFLFNIPHPELAHYNTLLVEFKKNNNIVRTGFLNEDELLAIYNLATVYVQPSYYEGFGFPVLEAMVCGTPIVISKTQALVEVAGGAALIADPNDPNDFAEKITELINNPSLRAQMIKKGFERVRDFSWEKTAKEMIEVYKKIN